MFNLIVSQGRIADRKNGTIEGAKLTAEAIEREYGVKGTYIGQPSEAKEDDWHDSLNEASSTLNELQHAVECSIESRKQTVMVANTCSASLASLPVVAQAHPDVALLWVDAHGDFNTPDTTDSGYLGGMVVAAACGLWESGYGSGIQSNQVIIVGARDIERHEHGLLNEAGVVVIPAEEVTCSSVNRAINGRNVWIHIDWDVLEPGYIPADYKVPGGLLPIQIEKIFSSMTDVNILGIEIAEYHVPFFTDNTEKELDTLMRTIRPLLNKETAAFK